VELGQLVQADWISYCELDRVRRRGRLQVDRIGDEYNVEELDEGLFWGGRDERAPGLPPSPAGRRRRVEALGLRLTQTAAQLAPVRALVQARRRRVRAQRPDPLAALAHQDVPVRSHGPAGLHRARPARPRSAPATPCAALASGEDSAAPRGRPGRPRARGGDRLAGSDPARERRGDRVRVRSRAAPPRRSFSRTGGARASRTGSTSGSKRERESRSSVSAALVG
jgi:hypothetical protein